MRSPPATNSQLSTVEAVRLVRGKLQKGMVVHQRDLDQAFMRIHVKIEDEEGKPATLRLRPPGMELETDQMVFGLAIGPLGLASVLAAIQELVETVISDKAKCVANVRVMDEYAILGPPTRYKSTAR